MTVEFISVGTEILLGNIVKVTPTSKAVGDLAIFMFKNGLTKENILLR